MIQKANMKLKMKLNNLILNPKLWKIQQNDNNSQKKMQIFLLSNSKTNKKIKVKPTIFLKNRYTMDQSVERKS